MKNNIDSICKSVKDKSVRRHIRSKFAAEWATASEKHGPGKAKEMALQWAQFRADTHNGNYQ